MSDSNELEERRARIGELEEARKDGTDRKGGRIGGKGKGEEDKEKGRVGETEDVRMSGASEGRERHIREALVWMEGRAERNLEESCTQAILLMLHYCYRLLCLVIYVYRCAPSTTFALHSCLCCGHARSSSLILMKCEGFYCWS